MTFFTFFLSNFSVRTLQCFQKIFFIFFDHKKLKKPPQKVAYLWQLGVFFLCSPNCPKHPRTSFPFYILFYPIVSAKVSECMASNNIISVFKERIKLSFIFAEIDNHSDISRVTYCSRGSYGNFAFFLKRSQYISLDFYVLKKTQNGKCSS